MARSLAVLSAVLLVPIALVPIALVPIAYVPIAHAGLRPLYGGELTVVVPAPAQTQVPSQAWNAVEVTLANVLGGRLAGVAEGPPAISSNGIMRFTIRSDAAWPDGSLLDARGVVTALHAALTNAVVSLPAFSFRAEGHEVIVEPPAPAVDVARYLDLPWLRLTHAGAGGAFHARKSGIDADVNGLGGRGLVDRIRVEVKEGRKLEPSPDGVALLQSGGDGRPVFVVPRPKSPVRDAVIGALGSLDRGGLARLFVRTAAHVPESWPLAAVTARDEGVRIDPVVLLIDASERDQKTVAERLQVLLRDHRIAAHISSEERTAYFDRLSRGDYDLAIVALPPAPYAVQAATLVRIASGPDAAAAFWTDALAISGARQEEALLRETASSLGASLLYMEEGGVTRGSHVRDANGSAAWDLDLANAWLAVPGAP